MAQHLPPIEHGVPLPTRPKPPRLIDFAEGMQPGDSRACEGYARGKSIVTSLRAMKDGRVWTLRHDGATWRIWRLS